MKWVIFHFYLKPMIEENYEARKRGDADDEWFWADRLASEWGYFVYAKSFLSQLKIKLDFFKPST